MELRDIYDENRNLIKSAQDRDIPLNDGEYIVAVGIWVVNNENKLLMTKRAPEKSFASNKWENTSGHVQAGEDSISAIIRELKEETGIDVTEDEIEFIGSAKVSPYFGDNYFVRKEIPLSNIELQDGETSDARYIGYDEFHEMAENEEFSPALMPHLSQFIDRFYELWLKD